MGQHFGFGEPSTGVLKQMKSIVPVSVRVGSVQSATRLGSMPSSMHESTSRQPQEQQALHSVFLLVDLKEITACYSEAAAHQCSLKPSHRSRVLGSRRCCDSSRFRCSVPHSL